VPSLCSFIGLTNPIYPLIFCLPIHAAILICLEHSFWIFQQGSDLIGCFIKAWESYLKTRHALVDQELDNFLRSKGSKDWFTMKHCPSDKELAECRKIALNNLLC